MKSLNEHAWQVVDELAKNAATLRVDVSHVAGCRVIDCGGAATGSLQAGLLLARACLANQAEVVLVPGPFGLSIQVTTDSPLTACLASQYAGWQIQVDRYFAMGSGPMRALANREAMIQQLHLQETAACAVGILESKHHPTPEVVAAIVEKLPIAVEHLSLLVAPASSIAGTIQVVARSVETAMHKMHELEFDVSQIVSANGVAPLPPVAKKELQAIGRTNDAILYGGQVTLWLHGDQEQIDAIGPKIPSNYSKDHGELFETLFARYGDFYKIDPMLFSPAEVTLVNLTNGITRKFGQCFPALLEQSFYGANA